MGAPAGPLIQGKGTIGKISARRSRRTLKLRSSTKQNFETHACASCVSRRGSAAGPERLRRRDVGLCLMLPPPLLLLPCCELRDRLAA